MPRDEHVQWMRLALREATKCLATGDVPVGAVVVRDGQVVGRGHNRREADADPTAHAEVLALKDAAATLGAWRLDTASLVVTLEPCVMCAGACVAARIDTLVFGAFDDKAGACGSRWDVVRDPASLHKPQVYAGVLAGETSALLADFFAGRRDGRV